MAGLLSESIGFLVNEDVVVEVDGPEVLDVDHCLGCRLLVLVPQHESTLSVDASDLQVAGGSVGLVDVEL